MNPLATPPSNPGEARRAFWRSFSLSQLASVAATAADFGLLFLLTEVFHVWYVPAVALGAAAGAVTNFFMNRHWSFGAAHINLGRQAWRYAVVSVGSLALNTGGTYLVTESAGLHYGISVVVVSIAVGFVFNFPLQKYFVFASR